MSQPAELHKRLLEDLTTLKLSRIAEIYRETLDETTRKNVSMLEVLSTLFSEEAIARAERTLQRRIRQARLPKCKTLEDYDFNYAKRIPKQKILRLFDGQFIEKKECYVFIGPTGTGKSHLLAALGYRACEQGISVRFTRAIDMINVLTTAQINGTLEKALRTYVNPSLLLLDELGYLPIDKRGSDLMFQVVAARLVEWIVPLLKQAGKSVWVVIDGGYTKRPFLRRALKTGVTIVGRLRKDAALRDLPPPLRKGQRRGRGRPRMYGKHKISLAKRGGQKRGWQTIGCTVYGETTTKNYKTFLATYGPTGGVIRVVLVKEAHGWYAFFCTDPNVSVVEILEAFSDRATIEQDFHDVKEVWGSGQQQVRNIWNNLAVYNLNLWMHTMVELWAWDKRHDELCNRSDSPWDDADRRPSPANRRKALRAQIMREELSTITSAWSLPTKIIRLAKTLMSIAA